MNTHFLQNYKTSDRFGIANCSRRPIAVDLFAGAGGFSLGIEQAGFDVAVAVEQDPIHAAVYTFNFPHSRILCTDIATLSGQEIQEAVEEWASANGQQSPWSGEIDLVFGGPPCQGFSMIGKGLVDDARNHLVFEFCRLVKELQPRYFVMENVPGLGQQKYQSLLKRLMREFKAAGYQISKPVQVLNAADFGVPQKRRRLFLLGVQLGGVKLAYPYPELRDALCVRRGAIRSPEPVSAFASTLGEEVLIASVTRKRSHPEAPLSQTLREAEALPWSESQNEREKARKVPRTTQHNPSSKELQPFYITVREAIADLPNLDNFTELYNTDCIQLTPEQLYQMQDLATPYVKKLRDLIPDPSNFAYPRLWNPQLLTSSARTQHTETSIERFEQTQPGQLEPISRLRRLDWNRPCYTLRAGTGYDRGSYTSPRPIHPEYPRVISVREAARLHSFPDWFRFHVTKWHGFRQVGNAVPPLLARVLGSQILTKLGIEPSVPTTSLGFKDPQLLRFTLLQASQYWKSLKK